MIPERRLFLGPEAHQPVVGGYRLEPFPKQRSQCIRKCEIDKSLAVQTALPIGNLEAYSAQDFVLTFRNLKLRDAPGKVIHGEMHRLPQNRQRADVIECRATNTIVAQGHRHYLRK